MANSHILSVPLAVEYGSNEALFLTNICWWIEKNIANEKHFYKGRWWTYNSMTAFTEIFPYFTKKMIRRIIENLEKKGAIFIDNFNKNGYDKTQWYAVTPKVFDLYTKGSYECPLLKSLTVIENEPAKTEIDDVVNIENENKEQSPVLQNGQIHVPKRAYASDKFGKSMCPNGHFEVPAGAHPSAHLGTTIPDIKTDIKPSAASVPQKNGQAQKIRESENQATQDVAAEAAEFYETQKHETPESAIGSVKKLKQVLLRLNDTFVFSPPFYPAALAHLIKNNLDAEYLRWYYLWCKKHTQSSLVGLFYKAFFDERIYQMFLIEKQKQAPPPPVFIVCPVCEVSHDRKNAKCPQCGFLRDNLGNQREIDFSKKLLLLSAEERASYEDTGIAIMYDKNLDMFQKVEAYKNLRTKYGLPTGG
jgi:hypothetical protein